MNGRILIVIAEVVAVVQVSVNGTLSAPMIADYLRGASGSLKLLFRGTV